MFDQKKRFSSMGLSAEFVGSAQDDPVATTVFFSNRNKVGTLMENSDEMAIQLKSLILAFEFLSKEGFCNEQMPDISCRICWAIETTTCDLVSSAEEIALAAAL